MSCRPPETAKFQRFQPVKTRDFSERNSNAIKSKIPVVWGDYLWSSYIQVAGAAVLSPSILSHCFFFLTSGCAVIGQVPSLYRDFFYAKI